MAAHFSKVWSDNVRVTRPVFMHCSAFVWLSLVTYRQVYEAVKALPQGTKRPACLRFIAEQVAELPKVSPLA